MRACRVASKCCSDQRKPKENKEEECFLPQSRPLDLRAFELALDPALQPQRGMAPPDLRSVVSRLSHHFVPFSLSHLLTFIRTDSRFYTYEPLQPNETVCQQFAEWKGRPGSEDYATDSLT